MCRRVAQITSDTIYTNFNEKFSKVKMSGFIHLNFAQIESGLFTACVYVCASVVYVYIHISQSTNWKRKLFWQVNAIEMERMACVRVCVFLYTYSFNLSLYIYLYLTAVYDSFITFSLRVSF